MAGCPLQDKLKATLDSCVHGHCSLKLHSTLTLIIPLLQDWLYDEGEDETKSVYTQKLEELLRLGSPLEQREREDRLRPAAAQALTAAANHYNSVATSDHAKYSHITGDERNKVPACLDINIDGKVLLCHERDGLFLPLDAKKRA